MELAGLPPAERLPRHLAIIMDGNGRWAAARGLPRTAGHRQGAEALRRTVEACIKAGIPCLTVFAFSLDNWKRPAAEVSFLMRLLERYLRREGRRLMREGVRLRAVGDLRRLPAAVGRVLREQVAACRRGERLTLTLALSYGGRWEVVEAAKRYARARARGTLPRGGGTVEGFRRFLVMGELPPVDLLVRTGGEKRLSDFILYDLAYAELYFTDVLWPDFDEEELVKALVDYAGRQRRFGGVPEGG